MQFYRSYSDVISGFPQELAALVSQATKNLLESRHLYQSIVVDVNALVAKVASRTETRSKENFLKWAANAAQWPWIVSDRSSLQALLQSLSSNVDSSRVTWQAPDIKSFCKQCDRLEPFNAVDATNFLAFSNPASGGFLSGKTRHQVYVTSYLCQSCKAIPEVFVIQREGSKLTLCGRSPMETVLVPKAVPKEISRFVSGAAVAHNSGQTLAGLFLLRTAVEQWSMLYALPEDRADEALEKYMQNLPEDFKARFPSMRNLYGELSAAIHRADGNVALFDIAMAKVNEHFEARRLFKLPTPPKGGE
jgi:hypothetical protein